MIKPISAWTLIITLLGGCKSVHQNLGEQFDRVEKIYSETYDQNRVLENKQIGWGEALSIMLKNNLELQRAQDSLERARESRAQIYWDLVPSLRFSASLSKALTDVGTN
jgi:uncharacterized protein YceK